MSSGLGSFLPLLLGLLAAAFSLAQLGLAWAAGWAWGQGKGGWALALAGGVVLLFVLHLALGFGMALL